MDTLDDGGFFIALGGLVVLVFLTGAIVKVAGIALTGRRSVSRLRWQERAIGLLFAGDGLSDRFDLWSSVGSGSAAPIPGVDLRIVDDYAFN